MIPTSTDVAIQLKDKVPAAAEAVVVFFAEGGTDPAKTPGLARDDANAVRRLLGGNVVRGKAKEVGFDVVEAGAGKYRRVYVAGLGKVEKASPETVRQAAGAVTKLLRRHRVSNVAVFVPAAAPVAPEAAAEAVVVGVLLASFRYEEYKGAVKRNKEAEDDRPRRLDLTLVSARSDVDAKGLRAAVERGRTIADGQNFARTIASRPGNDINPPQLAKVAQAMAREVGLACRVLDEREMKRLGMGGILAVGAGSNATPPRMIVLEHRPANVGARLVSPSSRKGKVARNAGGRATLVSPLLVVGKAITFDTGGISIKPADKMGRMIYDKCGGMAVLGLMYAVARLDLPVHVVGILSSAENHISETAYRPGDILRMYNGVTVEVTNTDAEGRLVLGDALAWGIETYKPQAVVDLATLTGGVIVALGKTMAGVMSNDDTLVGELNAAGELAGEKMWRLPLGEDQRDYIKSDHADIVNSGGREGHPLQGGAFLSFFVPPDRSVPWAHLDIAGVADTEKELPYYAKGATGWGVRTLIEWVSGKDETRLKHATPRAAGG